MVDDCTMATSSIVSMIETPPDIKNPNKNHDTQLFQHLKYHSFFFFSIKVIEEGKKNVLDEINTSNSPPNAARPTINPSSPSPPYEDHPNPLVPTPTHYTQR